MRLAAGKGDRERRRAGIVEEEAFAGRQRGGTGARGGRGGAD